LCYPVHRDISRTITGQVNFPHPLARYMSGTSELDRFQRWLQSRLADLDRIESEEERIRVSNRLQNAIQECINFKQTMKLNDSVQNPFITRDEPVRVINETEVKAESNSVGRCNKCDAELLGDLDFCSLCGEFQ
jgi:hypothetical protein